MPARKDDNLPAEVWRAELNNALSGIALFNDLFPDKLVGTHIDAPGRLVGDQKLRVRGKFPCDYDLLHISAGQHTDRLIVILAEDAEVADKFICPFMDIFIIEKSVFF